MTLISWPRARTQVADACGRPYLALSVAFFVGGTTTPLAVYKDPDGASKHPAVIEADGQGRFPAVYVPVGLYREEVRGDGVELWNDDGLGEAAPETDTTTPSTIDPTAVAQTGDVKWRPDGPILPGWVRMNLRTIGNAGSGASELADVSAKALFLHLWQTFGDAIAPVYPARGASALADWTAGKTIGVPTMRGYAAAGVDDMGSDAANVLQLSVTMSLTAGSATAPVSSTIGLARLMTVVADGIPAGTYIAGIQGGDVILSQPAGAGAAGNVTARCSFFPDAQVAGAIGGAQSATLSGTETGTHTHTARGGTIALPGVALGYNTAQAGSTGASVVTGLGKPGTGSYGGTVNLLDPSTSDPVGVTVDPAGDGAPHFNVQPTRLGTFFMKL